MIRGLLKVSYAKQRVLCDLIVFLPGMSGMMIYITVYLYFSPYFWNTTERC
jgi:hypothetical protein